VCAVRADVDARAVTLQQPVGALQRAASLHAELAVGTGRLALAAVAWVGLDVHAVAAAHPQGRGACQPVGGLVRRCVGPRVDIAPRIAPGIDSPCLFPVAAGT